MKFIEYTLTSEMLCMGERIKKGQFKPTITTIPYSQITGALKAVLGNRDIHAVGHFPFKSEQEFRRNHVQILTYSPRDRALDTSILPLYIEYLVNVEGKVYIVETEDAKDVFRDNEDMTIYMGAFKSQGFGRCELKRCELKKDDLKIEEGLLNTRIPIEKAEKMEGSKEKLDKDKGGVTDFLKERFELDTVKKARYGYLFEPLSQTDGVYVLSLFEDSVITGPRFLLKEKGV
jgi:hypothetical protein